MWCCLTLPALRCTNECLSTAPAFPLQNLIGEDYPRWWGWQFCILLFCCTNECLSSVCTIVHLGMLFCGFSVSVCYLKHKYLPGVFVFALVLSDHCSALRVSKLPLFTLFTFQMSFHTCHNPAFPGTGNFSCFEFCKLRKTVPFCETTLVFCI